VELGEVGENTRVSSYATKQITNNCGPDRKNSHFVYSGYELSFLLVSFASYTSVLRSFVRQLGSVLDARSLHGYVSKLHDTWHPLRSKLALRDTRETSA
jgi:hypothetical protein